MIHSQADVVGMVGREMSKNARPMGVVGGVLIRYNSGPDGGRDSCWRAEGRHKQRQ